MDEQKNMLEIDLLHLVKLLLRRVWIIIISAVVGGCLTLSYTYFFITPIYKSSIKMYVNNSSFSVGSSSFSISSSELSAAKTLVDTYIVILNTRATLNDVIKSANLSYNYDQLNKMIEAKSVGGTEVFEIVVYSPDVYETKLIANTIADILPQKISDIVEGSSVRVVDYAVLPVNKTSPSYTKNISIGILLGVFISSGIIVLNGVFDKYIRSEDYLTQTYDIPLLAVIPDLNAPYGKSSYKKTYGYGEYK